MEQWELGVEQMALLTECIFGSIKLMSGIAAIVVPLLTVLEILKRTNVLEKFSALLEPLVSFLRLPKEAALPLVIGVFLELLTGPALFCRPLGITS